MRISPISGYSGSYSYIRPLQYDPGNTSGVSPEYRESVRKTAGNYSVGASRPVGYPDSETVSAGPRKGSKEAREIESHFNRIASDHYGENTTYGPTGQGFGYEASGRVFDVFI